MPRLRCVALVLCLSGLVGCASAPPSRTASISAHAGHLWQGRLSVSVHSDPPSTTTAAFQLSGTAEQGELQLFSPLGTTLAQLQWQPGSAHLHRGAAPEAFASLEALTEQLTGSALPLNALFDWLQGRDRPSPGWVVDLSALDRGELKAQREQPLPTVNLRVRLD